MNILQEAKVTVLGMNEAHAASTLVGSAALDTKGVGSARIDVIPSAVTTGNASSLKLQQSADGSTGWTDVTNGAFTTVPTTSDAEDVWTFFVAVNTAGLQRYLRSAYTHGASGSSTVTTLAYTADLNEIPTTAAEHGSAQQIVL